MSSTTIAPSNTTNTTNGNNNSANSIHNTKTNRTLFKNIKNNAPTTPNLKNIIGNGPTTSVVNTPTNVNSKKNNNIGEKNNNNNNNNKNNKNILFTPSSKTSMVSSKAASRDDSFLDIASIEKDLKGMEVFIGGISPCASPLKESSSSPVPITIVDLESSLSSTNAVCQNATVNKPSIKYSVNLLLSFKSANTKRPDEIDIVEIDQNNIVVPLSLPTTPYNNNNSNSNSHSHHHNSSTHNNTSVNGHKNPIFSSQISPFKIAYSQTNTPLSNNKTPTKRTNNSNLTTPQSINSHHQNNNNKSSTKKLNPIPFSLNTPTANNHQQKTPKKPNNNSAINTPKSNKKVNDVAAALAAAANAINSTMVADLDSTTTVNDPSCSEQSPKKVALKESDEKRLKARQRQIDIGKMTAGYKNYITLIPKSKRKPTDPKTPNKYQVCSKRSWDGQIKKWRRQLHENFDWTGIPFNEKELDSTLNEAAADDDCTIKLEKVFNQLEISSTTVTIEN